MMDRGVRRAVLRRLTAVERLARHGDPATRLRSELQRLSTAWRLLLTAHQPGPDGRCPACPPRVLRRRRWPCRVWLLGYRTLIGDAVPKPRNGTIRRAHAARWREH
ncbi:MAG TPA: hypothetical protein VG317_10365 [Pseudonocardiaceae bacterium]|jgi:hypothetical protein|nr:hypothetical protein [Pseudonocardiaceae bacterium]